MAELLHTECQDDPHPCFACKCRHWREHGMNLVVPQQWNDRPTVREMQREIVDTAKAEGRDIALADDKYRWT